MTKDEIEMEATRKAEEMLKICEAQAGLILSTLERMLVLNRCISLYLAGLEQGIRYSQKVYDFKQEGGEKPNA